MGIILQHSDKTVYITEYKSLNVTNWRLVLPKKTGISVVINNDMFFITRISLENFYTLADGNGLREKHSFKFQKSMLYCEKCMGHGIVDWVSKVTNSHNHIRKRIGYGGYKRDKKIPPVEINRSNLIILSKAKINKVNEHCPECLGCGIRLKRLID